MFVSTREMHVRMWSLTKLKMTASAGNVVSEAPIIVSDLFERVAVVLAGDAVQCLEILREEDELRKMATKRRPFIVLRCLGVRGLL